MMVSAPAGPSTAGPSRRNTRRPARQTDKSSKTPKDAAASKAAAVLSNAISDQVRERLKCSLLNENLMLRGDSLSSTVNDILVDAVLGQINDQGMHLPIFTTKVSRCTSPCGAMDRRECS